MRRNLQILLTLCTIAFLLADCAKIVTPTGGEKDSMPPKVVKIEPENGSVNFSGKQVRIFFDEYVTLNNPSENVLISPPPRETPEYSIAGKSLIIRFKDSLTANTTYNLIFSNAVKDYHEGNSLNLMHISFSTGDSIDNYAVSGKVTDAGNLTPSKDFMVMLYREDTDSLPLTSNPDYITKTGQDGKFVFNNISAGKYKIFALKDINSNLRYDLPNEEIAFSQNPVEAYPAQPDSIADSLKNVHTDILLYSFMQEDTVQKLLRPENPAEGVYYFPYKRPVKNFSATQTGHNTYFQKANHSGDTITWYMKEAVTDTLTFTLTADNQCDTVYLTPYKERPHGGRGRDRAKTDKLTVKVLNAGEYHKPLTLQFPYPIRPVDSFEINIITTEKSGPDTNVMRFSVPDTFLLELPLPMNLVEKKSYKIMIKDSVFQGYNGKFNDTLKFDFVAKALNEYGTLIMNYIVPDDGKNYVAVLKLGGKVIAENNLSSLRTITYPFLKPDTYTVEVFRDNNGNGRWDSGDYGQKRQAEKVFKIPHDIAIRAYWESEESFIISE